MTNNNSMNLQGYREVDNYILDKIIFMKQYILMKQYIYISESVNRHNCQSWGLRNDKWISQATASKLMCSVV